MGSAKDSSSGFTVAGQFGDPRAGDAIWPYVMILKDVFEADGAQAFNPALRKIAFIIRGDGVYQQFGFEGHDNIVVDTRKCWVSVDIGVPIARWWGKHPLEVADYLSHCFSESLTDIERRCSAKGLQVSIDPIRHRLDLALSKFRSKVASI